MWPDQWTISTVDGGRSAQFEHTVSLCIFDSAQIFLLTINNNSFFQLMMV